MSSRKKPQPAKSELNRELKVALEELTHSGAKTLCQRDFQVVLKFTDSGSDNIDFTFDILKTYLKKDHAEVRYSTVQMYDLLFMRYERFRSRALEKLDKFFKYGMGLKSQLPPPAAAAQTLVPLAIRVFDRWHTTFGPGCLKLRNGYNLLKSVHNVDFAAQEFVDPKVKKEKEENLAKIMKINKERLKNTNRQMEELRPEIEASLTSLESCFELLLPSDDLQPTKAPSTSDSDLRLHGVVNSREFKMEIQLKDKIEILEDEENGPILEAAKDTYKIVNNSFLPKVTAWVELINIAQGEPELMASAIYLRTRLQDAVAKYNRLEIVIARPVEDSESSSDSDFEEVPELKLDRKAVSREEIGFLSERLNLQKSMVSGCESSTSKETRSPEGEAKKPNDRKAQLLAIAPKLPFDIDLYHWEDEHLPTPTLVPVNVEGGRFWGASISEEIGEVAVPGGSESLRSRVIEFTGEFEPVRRACRAPLPSGKLCPRHDRHKCPLHGPVVDRDETGRIVNPEDVEKATRAQRPPGVPDWQDPKLLAQIKAATGLDLKMPVKGQRLNKKKKHPGLTDINPKVATAESRIAKKIFNKKAVKRVAASLDKLDRKRYRDKFGDQFNYVHDTS